MPHMPAVCDNCGTIFNSGIFVENSTNISLKGNKSGPCPRCGGWGHIPDGVFNFIGNAIEVLSAPERTVKELQRFSEILQLAQQEAVTLEEIEDKIQEETPQLNTLLELLPKTREEKRADLSIWINSILMILQMFLPLVGEEPVQEPVQKIEVNQVINHIYESSETKENILTQSQTSSTNTNQPLKVEKVGRNESCPCGSGIKYKRCHGHYEN